MKNNPSDKRVAKAARPKTAPQKAAQKVTAPKSAGAVEKKNAPAKAPGAKASKAVKSATAPKVAKTVATAKPRKGSNAADRKSLPPVTTFVAQVEIGWGNSLYIRGEGAPELSWERGILMKWEDDAWVYSTTGARAPVAFKFLVNDHTWAEGHNQHADPGSTSITTPYFHH